MVSRTKDLLAPIALSVLVGTSPLWADEDPESRVLCAPVISGPVLMRPGKPTIEPVVNPACDASRIAP